jgi:hypothetical protein
MAHLILPTHRVSSIGRRIAVGVTSVLVIGCTESGPTGPSLNDPTRTPAAGVASANGQGPQACVPDAKLIRRVAVSTEDVPGTWWRLTKDRFDELGVTDYKGTLEGFYGQRFDTLDDAIRYLIDLVAAYDTNGNGYVCAYQVRGTRAWLGTAVLFLFGIDDDKHVDD